MTDNTLVELSRRMRLSVLEMAYQCDGPAHLGGALSIIEILAVLYGKVLKHDPAKPYWEERDRFILSKGHGVLAFYAALYHHGYFSRKILNTFKQNGSDLIAHPVMNLSLGIESSNGSLGHGLSMSTGIAWGLRFKNSSSRVYTLLGDGECDEGSVWEAAAAASRLELSNLTAIVDCNKFQSDGAVAYDNLADSLSDKWKSLGWHVSTVFGHSISELSRALEFNDERKSLKKPKVILALTEKGHGVSFMRQNNLWHHNRLTENLFNKAREEVVNE